MYSVSRPKKKMDLCCSHGLMTFDLKIRCEVRRLWRRVAVASMGPPIYDVWMCVFIEIDAFL